MYTPSFQEFLKLSRKGNVIPVYKEINADLDTPVSAFLKMKKGKYAFLLESVEGQEKVARYSFLGSNPSLIFTSKGKKIDIICSESKTRKSFVTGSDPLSEIEKLMRDFKPVAIKGLPRFYGGLVGYIGYDMVRFFERIPDKNADDLKLPDSVFMLTDTILVFDHVNHTIKIVSNVILPAGFSGLSKVQKKKHYLEATAKIERIAQDFRRNVSGDQPSVCNCACDVRSNLSKASFQNMVGKGKKYIYNGDVVQVVLSQRLKTRLKKSAFDVYRSLRSLNPSPYMFFLQLKDFNIIGASPEMFVRFEDGVVWARPIAGTRPRGATEEQDKNLELELLADLKEKAEHLMLVDLGRNDLGRICASGKVSVDKFMFVERFSHVMHMVSEIRGIVKKGYSALDCLRACFPAGTVSGSPKIRAMEIIDELENLRRGPYAGCVGYISFSRNMDTCITIRTIVVKDKFAYIQAGAGIVADSVPKNEYFETLNKAKALIEAINN